MTGEVFNGKLYFYGDSVNVKCYTMSSEYWVMKQKEQPVRSELYGDSIERIRMCCQCEKPECDNCLSARENKTEERLSSVRELFLSLYHQGKSQKEICQEMNICRATFFNYKRRFV